VRSNSRQVVPLKHVETETYIYSSCAMLSYPISFVFRRPAYFLRFHSQRGRKTYYFNGVYKCQLVFHGAHGFDHCACAYTCFWRQSWCGSDICATATHVPTTHWFVISRVLVAVALDVHCVRGASVAVRIHPARLLVEGTSTSEAHFSHIDAELIVPDERDNRSLPHSHRTLCHGYPHDVRFRNAVAARIRFCT
jgi:hypothetical protein